MSIDGLSSTTRIVMKTARCQNGKRGDDLGQWLDTVPRSSKERWNEWSEMRGDKVGEDRIARRRTTFGSRPAEEFQ